MANQEIEPRMLRTQATSMAVAVKVFTRENSESLVNPAMMHDAAVLSNYASNAAEALVQQTKRIVRDFEILLDQLSLITKPEKKSHQLKLIK